MSYLFWLGKKQPQTSSPDYIPGFGNLQSSIILPRTFFSSVSSTSVISHGRNSVSISVWIWQEESKKKYLFIKDEQQDLKAVFHLLWSLRDAHPCQKALALQEPDETLSGITGCLISSLLYWGSSLLRTWTRVFSPPLIFKGAWHPRAASTNEQHSNVPVRWK